MIPLSTEVPKCYLFIGKKLEEDKRDVYRNMPNKKMSNSVSNYSGSKKDSISIQRLFNFRL